MFQTIPFRRHRPDLPIAFEGDPIPLVQAVSILLPVTFQTWNARFSDQLFLWRSEIFPPHYDPVVVHVDVTDHTLRERGKALMAWHDHELVVGALAGMGVAVQAYDLILASPPQSESDRALIETVAKAGSVYLGSALQLRDIGPDQLSDDASSRRWLLDTGGDQVTVPGVSLIEPASELAQAARGVGHLNVEPDADGVYRRLPLLVRHPQGGYTPALSLQVVCAFYRIGPEEVRFEPGNRIVLTKAQRHGWPEPRDIVIPVDGAGNMVVNFIGPWDRLTHYDAADIAEVRDDLFELDVWREEMAGRIAVISSVATGSTDTGRVPTDSYYPLGGVHTNAINTILTGSFLHDLPRAEMLLWEMILVALLLLLGLRLPAQWFAVSAVLLAVVFSAAAAVAFLIFGWIVDIAQAIGFTGLCLLLVPVQRYVHVLEGQVRERTQELERTHAKLASAQSRLIDELQREMEIAGSLQQSLMPLAAPETPGLDVAGRCIPATQVGGDFFQYFQRDQTFTVTLADVTGHSMEAAIPVVMFSGMLHTAMQRDAPIEAVHDQLNSLLCEALDRRTFVCLCSAQFDHTRRSVRLASCGSPHPYHYMARWEEVTEIELDALPLGMRPGNQYDGLELELEKGDRLLLFSDGIPEAQNGSQFGYDRIIDVFRSCCVDDLDAQETIDRLVDSVHTFSGDVEQADDVTCVTLRISH